MVGESHTLFSHLAQISLFTTYRGKKQAVKKKKKTVSILKHDNWLLFFTPLGLIWQAYQLHCHPSLKTLKNQNTSYASVK